MEAAHTVAGLIINRLRTIPPVGSQIREESYLFTVRAVSAAPSSGSYQASIASRSLGLRTA